jgi:hypothetical protein
LKYRFSGFDNDFIRRCRLSLALFDMAQSIKWSLERYKTDVETCLRTEIIIYINYLI